MADVDRRSPPGTLSEIASPKGFLRRDACNKANERVLLALFTTTSTSHSRRSLCW